MYTYTVKWLTRKSGQFCYNSVLFVYFLMLSASDAITYTNRVIYNDN